jgi:lipopolysaccharide biosynthesis regulator YciM
MGAALVLLLVGLGAIAAGVLIGRYYVPDDRQLRRTARHSRGYIRALSHLITRDYDTVISELRAVVEENVDDVEPYFALGAVFRSRGEHERAIRVHQALAQRERDKRKLRLRAMYELGLDFRAAGMPRRATRAMEEVLRDESGHEGALRVLAALYEEQARFNEAAGLWQRLGKKRGEDTGHREHHLLVAAAQAALGRGDLDSAKQLLKAAKKHEESAHFFAAAAELAAARDNHRGAKERLRHALVADPGLAPHLLPGLIAAEQGLAVHEAPGDRAGHDTDDLDDDGHSQAPQLAAAQAPQLAAAQVPQLAAAQAPQLAAAQAPQVAAEAPQLAAASLPQLAAAAVPVLPAVTDTTLVPAPAILPPGTTRRAGGVLAQRAPGRGETKETPSPSQGETKETPSPSVAERVLALVAEVEAETGPRLELALIRAQLVPPGDVTARAELAKQLAARFPDSLAARVATARLAIASEDPAAIRGALEGLASERGALAWALHGRWQCVHCGNRPGPFSWRCGQCRRWNTLRMETGVEPPPVAPRERRAAPRVPRPEALLGAAPDEALPGATLDVGLSVAELASAGTRRSLLGRVGGWVSGVWRRDAP